MTARSANLLRRVLLFDVLLEHGQRGSATRYDAIRPRPEHRLALVHVVQLIREVTAKQPGTRGLEIVNEAGEIKVWR